MFLSTAVMPTFMFVSSARLSFVFTRMVLERSSSSEVLWYRLFVEPTPVILLLYDTWIFCLGTQRDRLP